MSLINEASSLQDVCFAVCTALHRVGTVAVLTGGSAATYYAPESYQSQDADFIVMFSGNVRSAGSVIHELGYREIGGTYHHDKSAFTLEFPPGPLAVGNDLIHSFDTVKRGDETLHVLTRTDCVRDRLAAFYFFTDRSALAAAIAVARSGSVHLESIRKWSIREGEASRFSEFSDSLRR